MSLYDKVRDFYEFQCRKHDLAPNAEDYANEQINKMTNNELLYAISEALKEMKE